MGIVRGFAGGRFRWRTAGGNVFGGDFSIDLLINGTYRIFLGPVDASLIRRELRRAELMHSERTRST